MAAIRTVQSDNIFALCILNTTWMTTTILLYIYAIFKLWSFRKHILLQKRFPTLSFLMVALSIFNALFNTIRLWLQYAIGYRIHHLGIPAMLVYGLINVRLCLIYLRWSHHQINPALKHSLESSSPKSQSQNNSDRSVSRYQPLTHNIYFHWCVLSILFFSLCSCIIFVVADRTPYRGMMIGTCWFLQVILSIVLISVIRCKTVKEGIGCIKETVMLLILGVSVGILYPLSSAFPAVALAFNIFTNSVPWLMGLIPLYFPLYCIHKMEGTLNPNTSLGTTADIKCEHPLLVFIESKQNYQIFFQYLSYCWAVENLLFYQKVSIMYHIILKHKNMDTMNTIINMDTTSGGQAADEVHIKVPPASYHRNKFEFLTSLYVHYESLINDSDRNAVEFGELRTILHRMQQEIYDEFIRDGAQNEINISWETKQQLVHLLKNNENVNVFQSFNDFLHIFDDAMLEIFRLLSSMYSYQFKAFLSSECEKRNV